MSDRSDKFEQAIASCIKPGDRLPGTLPLWMEGLGIIPRSEVLSASRIGSKDKNNKTDVLIKIKNSASLKISAKLANAHYFGNWYGHQRFLNEFGEDAFKKQTNAATNWANNVGMNRKNAELFVGVSICYGKRGGDTCEPFLDIYTLEDMFSICRGVGDGDNVANCLYSAESTPKSLNEMIDNLLPIKEESIKQLAGVFKVIYRPINPITERSNRSKNVYTMFKPTERLDSPLEVTSLNELKGLGTFITVKPNRLNHNRIIKILERCYNIIIPTKQRK